MARSKKASAAPDHQTRTTSYANHAYEGNHQNRLGSRGHYGDLRAGEEEEEEEEEEERAPSDRTVSEYTVANERIASPHVAGTSYVVQPHSRTHDTLNHSKDVPDIYVTDYSTYKRPPSEYSHYSTRTYQSGASSARTKTSRRGGVVIETMSAPNPFCPNTRGACCLMLLLNLGLILLTLGFVIVLQLFKPPFVWYLGLLFLIVGFITLLGSLVYWVYLCRLPPPPVPYPYTRGPGELYWTHHWQKRIQLPEVHRTRHSSDVPTRTATPQDDKMSDRLSERSDARYSAGSKARDKYSSHQRY